MNDELEKLQKIVDESNNIVFFGGAGVSTESGIPDFRSVDGIYNQKYKYPPEVILSHDFFQYKTKRFYEFYKEKMIFLNAEPNKAHLWLARAEKANKVTAVITQNIDSLHQKAGSKNVFELHGSVYRNYCTKCGKFYDVNYILDSIDIPKCTCGGVIKPDVVLYDEGLCNEVVDGAINAIKVCDTIIIAGTSLTVYPAANLLHFFKGNNIVLINRDSTSFDKNADLIIHDNVGEVLSQIKLN